MASDNLPSIADLRQFLTDTFNDEEITSLCFDYFPNVHDNFTLGMSKAHRIQSLIEYCQRRDVIPNLHAAIQRARPQDSSG
jgi:hypothetical protein